MYMYMYQVKSQAAKADKLLQKLPQSEQSLEFPEPLRGFKPSNMQAHSARPKPHVYTACVSTHVLW